MSIAAIISNGIGPGGSIKYAMTLGYDQGAAPLIVDVAVARLRFGAGWSQFAVEGSRMKFRVRT